MKQNGRKQGERRCIFDHYALIMFSVAYGVTDEYLPGLQKKYHPNTDLANQRLGDALFLVLGLV